MYVVRLSCELPYAVGVRKNTAESITLCQRKQSKRQTISGVLSRACSSIFCPHQTCLILLCSLPMLPHTGQSSQLSVDPYDGNAQFLANLTGAVVWTHKAQELQESREAAQSGQSSQLLVDGNPKKFVVRCWPRNVTSKPSISR